MQTTVSTSLKAELLRKLMTSHNGPAQAITAEALYRTFGLPNDRPVRQAIRELIADGIPIASSTQPPAGYFIVTSREQAEKYAGSVKSRLIEDALRRRDFRRAADCWLTPAKQGELKL